ASVTVRRKQPHPCSFPLNLSGFCRLSCQHAASAAAQKDNLGDDMVIIENKTFDEISIGESAQLERTLTRDDIMLFGVMSGDANPTHFKLDDDSRQHR